MAASLMIMAIYFDITFGYEWIFIAENDPSFRKALANLESSMSDAINSTNIYRIKEPFTAKLKLLNGGSLYKTVLIMAETDCKKADIKKINNINSCQLTDGRLICDAEMYVHRRKYKLEKISCG